MDILKYSDKDTRMTVLGYESLVWLRNDEGKEFSCTMDDNRRINDFDELYDHEKETCMDVSLVLNKEHW